MQRSIVQSSVGAIFFLSIFALPSSSTEYSILFLLVDSVYNECIHHVKWWERSLHILFRQESHSPKGRLEETYYEYLSYSFALINSKGQIGVE